MSGIKYSLRQESTSFSIGTTNLRSSNGSLIDTNGCVALLVLSGFAVATINFEKRILRKGDFVLLFYDSTFSMLSISAAFSVRYVSFAYHLIEEAIYKPLSINFWNTIYSNPVFRPNERDFKLLVEWWYQMEWVNNIKDYDYQEEILKNNIRNLLVATDIEIMDHAGDSLRNSRGHAWMLVNRFFRLLSSYCRETRVVQFYADKLSITSTYLYKLCRKNFQLSPKELIDRQTVTEIKTYLVNTDMSVKHIASELNFEDVSYMCRYFRRQTGMSPMDYRAFSKRQVLAE